VCTQIKQHAEYGSVPVILMSGVVNKTVADKAIAVHADELIRKPFQPQELIGRVKGLLNPKAAPPASPDHSASPHAHSPFTAPGAPSAANTLSGLFAQPTAPSVSAPPPPPEQRQADSIWPRALAEAFTPKPAPPEVAGGGLHTGQPAQSPQPPARPSTGTADVHKLRGEIARLELLVKKLQTELHIERQYTQALELQIHTLTHSE
jgi:CheY-like chemotaxis protein